MPVSREELRQYLRGETGAAAPTVSSREELRRYLHGDEKAHITSREELRQYLHADAPEGSPYKAMAARVGLSIGGSVLGALIAGPPGAVLGGMVGSGGGEAVGQNLEGRKEADFGRIGAAALWGGVPIIGGKGSLLKEAGKAALKTGAAGTGEELTAQALGNDPISIGQALKVGGASAVVGGALVGAGKAIGDRLGKNNPITSTGREDVGMDAPPRPAAIPGEGAAPQPPPFTPGSQGHIDPLRPFKEAEVLAPGEVRQKYTRERPFGTLPEGGTGLPPKGDAATGPFRKSAVDADNIAPSLRRAFKDDPEAEDILMAGIEARRHARARSIDDSGVTSDARVDAEADKEVIRILNEMGLAQDAQAYQDGVRLRGEALNDIGAEAMFKLHQLEIRRFDAALDAGNIKKAELHMLNSQRWMLHLEGVTAEGARVLRGSRRRQGQIEHKRLDAMEAKIKAAEASGTVDPSSAAQMRMAVSVARHNPKGFNKFVKDTALPSFADKIYFYWLNNILSAFSTHAINIGSTAINVARAVPEAAVAAGIDAARVKIRGGERTRYAAEAVLGARVFESALRDTRKIPGAVARRVIDVTKGSKAAFDDAVAAGHQAASWKAAVKDATNVLLTRLNDIEVLPDAVGGTKYTEGLRGHVNPIKARVLHGLVGAPTKMLALADDYAKAIAMRVELHQRALREVRAQRLTGQVAQDEWARIVSDPPEDMIEAVVKKGLSATFNEPMGPRTSSVSGLRVNEGVRYLMPFVRTIGNIVKTALKGTPLGLVKAGRSLHAGQVGEAADQAAQAVVGTAFGLAMMQLADEGVFTTVGPSNQAEEINLSRTGWMPVGLRVGDHIIDATRVDPLGIQLILAAGAMELAKAGVAVDFDALAEKFMATMGNGIADKSYLDSLKTVIQAATAAGEGDVGHLGEEVAKQVVRGFVPYSSLLQNVERGLDSTPKSVRSAGQSVKKALGPFGKLGILGGDSLEPVRDVWGQPIIMPGPGVVRMLSPFRITEISNDEPTREMLRIGWAPGIAQRTFRETIGGKKVTYELTPEEYGQFAEMSGRMAKERMLAESRLPRWRTMSVDQKKGLYTRVFNESRAHIRNIMFGKVRKNAEGDESRVERKDAAPPTFDPLRGMTSPLNKKPPTAQGVLQ